MKCMFSSVDLEVTFIQHELDFLKYFRSLGKYRDLSEVIIYVCCITNFGYWTNHRVLICCWVLVLLYTGADEIL